VEGHVSGTNRGEVIARIKRDGETVRGRAVILDTVVGPTAVSIAGTLRDLRGDLELSQFRGSSAGIPVLGMLPASGRLTLNFAADQRSAQGQWTTDIGTSGPFNVEATKVRWLKWLWNITAAYACWWVRLAYFEFLVAAFVLDGLHWFRISYPGLMAALIPALYLYRYELTAMIRLFGLTEAGPFKFQAPVSQDLQLIIQQQVQDAMLFVTLDQFFVPRTKSILFWMAQTEPVDQAQFNAFAAQIGVPQENIEVTRNVLLMSGCVAIQENRLVLNERGRRYVAWLRHAAPAPAPAFGTT
jgi:hypothetical protein